MWKLVTDFILEKLCVPKSCSEANCEKSCHVTPSIWSDSVLKQTRSLVSVTLTALFCWGQSLCSELVGHLFHVAQCQCKKQPFQIFQDSDSACCCVLKFFLWRMQTRPKLDWMDSINLYYLRTAPKTQDCFQCYIPSLNSLWHIDILLWAIHSFFYCTWAPLLASPPLLPSGIHKEGICFRLLFNA